LCEPIFGRPSAGSEFHTRDLPECRAPELRVSAECRPTVRPTVKRGFCWYIRGRVLGVLQSTTGARPRHIKKQIKRLLIQVHKIHLFWS